MRGFFLSACGTGGIGIGHNKITPLLLGTVDVPVGVFEQGLCIGLVAGQGGAQLRCT